MPAAPLEDADVTAMTTCSSLVVQRSLATLRQVEEALARQMLFGADVVTNLLEVAPPPATDEALLTAVLAESHGLAPTPLASLLAPDPDVVAAVPRAIAEEHGIVAFARENGAILIAVSEPLPESTHASLAQRLGAKVIQTATPVFRLRQALDRTYGVPMDRRSERLLAQLGDRAPSSRPPPSELGAAFARTLAISELREEERASQIPPPMARLPSAPPPPAAASGIPPAPLVPDTPRPPSLTSLASFTSAGPAIVTSSSSSSSSSPFDQLTPRPLAPPISPPTPEEMPAPSSSRTPTTTIRATVPPPPKESGETKSGPTPKPSGLLALQSFLDVIQDRADRADRVREQAKPSKRPPRQSASRLPTPGKKRRGPFTREEAEEALELAPSSDVVFACVLEYAHQYAAYAALFLVKDDLAEGWDARGTGATGQRVRKMGVPLDLPSAFAAARTRGSVLTMPTPRDGLDAVVASDLGRDGATDVLVLPLLLGKRVVALLWLDDGGEPLVVEEITEVLELAAKAGGALANIIVRKKKPKVAAIAEPTPATRVRSEPPRKGISVAPTDLEARAKALAAALLPARPRRSVPPAAPIALVRPSQTKITSPLGIESPAQAMSPSSSQPISPPIVEVKPPHKRSVTPPMPSFVPLPRKRPTSVPPPNVTPSPRSGTTDPSFPATKLSEHPPRPVLPTRDVSPVPPPLPPHPPQEVTPYHTKSDPPARATPAEVAPIPPRNPTLRRMPSIESTPRPSEGRTTDPLFEEVKVSEPTPTAKESIARIDLVTVAAPKSAPGGLIERVGSRTFPTPTPLQAEPADVPAQVEHVPDPHPGVASLALAPPPLLAGKRKLTPPIPREEPERPATSTPPPIPAHGSSTDDALAALAAVTGVPRAEPTPEIPIVVATPAPGFADTSEPEVIEATEVTEAELEDLFADAAGPRSEGSRVEAYPARSPPKPLDGGSISLPKVMVALDPENVILVERVIRGGAAGEKAASELVTLGAEALAAIMDRFPGPTREGRNTAPAQLPPPKDAGPLLSLLADLGRTALRDVLARTSDPSPDARFWATYLLATIVSPESLEPLLPRLVDDDPAVRRVAGLAARALLGEEPTAAIALVDPIVGVLLDAGATATLRIRAAEALADLRSAEAVEGLILGLASYERDVGLACHDALVVLARHDPTRDGGTWPAWYAANKHRRRVEWLIEALLDDDESMRDAASIELKAITKVYFGYYANLSRAEREAAHRRYLMWWSAEGRTKLGDRA